MSKAIEITLGGKQFILDLSHERRKRGIMVKLLNLIEKHNLTSGKIEETLQHSVGTIDAVEDFFCESFPDIEAERAYIEEHATIEEIGEAMEHMIDLLHKTFSDSKAPAAIAATAEALTKTVQDIGSNIAPVVQKIAETREDFMESAKEAELEDAIAENEAGDKVNEILGGENLD